jgi:type IV secretory pathway TrbF-like protein
MLTQPMRRRRSAEVPSVAGNDVDRHVRENSRAVWNEWVGGWRYRERIAYSFAAAFGLIALFEGAALVKEAGKPAIPPAIITVDDFGQVRDVRRPVLSPIGDAPTRHFLAQFVDDIFATSTSGDEIAAQYGRARYFLTPGSAAFLEVQQYWDRTSPLRKLTNGTLQIVVPPKQTIHVHVTSYLAQGKSPDGAEIWELQWTLTPRELDGTNETPTLYRGRLTFKRPNPPKDTSDDAVIANPFGIAIDSFTWDQVR